jgi:hypothetical protein
MSNMNEGTGIEDGQPSTDDEFDDEYDPFDNEFDDDDFEEGSDDDEGQSSDDGDNEGSEAPDQSAHYKELQRAYTESRDRIKELEQSLSEKDAVAHKFVQFGGVDKAMAALEYINTDTDFRELATRKANKETIGLDESKMSPQQKEALDLVRKVVRSELTPFAQELDGKLKTVIDKEISPHTSAMQQANLEVLTDKMTDKYGEKWIDQLDSMEKLKGELPERVRVAPSFKDLETLYISSLSQDGKLDAFTLARAKVLSKSKKAKSTNRPRSTGDGAKRSSKERPKTIAEAAKIAESRDR